MLGLFLFFLWFCDAGASPTHQAEISWINKPKFLKCFGIVAQVFNEAIYEGALYIVLDLEPLSSRPLVDRRHLI
jgi:hypothetical protein